MWRARRRNSKERLPPFNQRCSRHLVDETDGAIADNGGRVILWSGASEGENTAVVPVHIIVGCVAHAHETIPPGKMRAIQPAVDLHGLQRVRISIFSISRMITRTTMIMISINVHPSPVGIYQ